MVISFGELGVSGDGGVPACNRIVEGWDARAVRIEEPAGRHRYQVKTCLHTISSVIDYRFATGNPLVAHAVMPPWTFT